MAASFIFRLGRVKGNGSILVALKHNKRLTQAERGAGQNIDPARASLNYCLFGNDTPEKLNLAAKIALLEAGIERPRKDAVMAVEVLFSLPIDRHQQDTRQYFMDCLQWTQKHMPGQLLSFDVHLDEAAPHAHAIILPLVDGCLRGRDVIGNTGNLNRLIRLFYSEVARHYGLATREDKRLSPSESRALERQVLQKLASDPVLKSNVWACVRDAIHKDPKPFAQTLGISHQQLRQEKRSVVEIMTSKGKGKA